MTARRILRGPAWSAPVVAAAVAPTAPPEYPCLGNSTSRSAWKIDAGPLTGAFVEGSGTNGFESPTGVTLVSGMDAAGTAAPATWSASYAFPVTPGRTYTFTTRARATRRSSAAGSSRPAAVAVEVVDGRGTMIESLAVLSTASADPAPTQTLPVTQSADPKMTPITFAHHSGGAAGMVTLRLLFSKAIAPSDLMANDDLRIELPTVTCTFPPA
ncbi:MULTISPECIES: hypothetical protein [unclassified Pseudoclavibacter]|uniref:hypothetical protein n=1 Tax=unclassified Pseudoclavibacter TaxID=2615177 RepID=UPI000CE786C5|nr:MULTISPECIES: hypothetical protein [unclassified Pseudoclavibacter]PPF73517.1 hypothetical protein C5B99_16280 [Pseudoclavibacter sp. Z016]PPG01482.1 hypothetical protein C5E06_16020 [Pseudoclavibacter sp. RFBI5]